MTHNSLNLLFYYDFVCLHLQDSGQRVSLCLPNNADDVRDLQNDESVSVVFESSTRSRNRGFLFEYQGDTSLKCKKIRIIPGIINVFISVHEQLLATKDLYCYLKNIIP